MAALAHWAPSNWRGSFAGTESTLHQLSPYIGKTKSAIAGELIDSLTSKGDLVYEPFAGSGTIALESWIHGRDIVANDLNPYAYLLLRAKLGKAHSLEDELGKIERYKARASKLASSCDLRTVPKYVRSFYHPTTLRETLAWCTLLRQEREWLLLSCLMGILHHQRPGFLSFPASHAVPYLRLKRFPPEQFPELYEYRSVADRLERKLRRALSRVPKLDETVHRTVRRTSALTARLPTPANAIITSPPYMRRLAYARDNRLRLWFLGHKDTRELEPNLSPGFTAFMKLMDGCLKRWHKDVVAGGHCALILGDEPAPAKTMLVDRIIGLVGDHQKSWKLERIEFDEIPFERRVRRHAVGSKAEAIIVLKRL